jgi:hypothetical protein
MADLRIRLGDVEMKYAKHGLKVGGGIVFDAEGNLLSDVPVSSIQYLKNGEDVIHPEMHDYASHLDANGVVGADVDAAVDNKHPESHTVESHLGISVTLEAIEAGVPSAHDEVHNWPSHSDADGMLGAILDGAVQKDHPMGHTIASHVGLSSVSGSALQAAVDARHPEQHTFQSHSQVNASGADTTDMMIKAHDASHTMDSHSDVFSSGSDVTNAVAKRHTKNADVTTGVLSGNLNLNSNKVTNLGTPTNAGDAVTKAYADATVSGEEGPASNRYQFAFVDEHRYNNSIDGYNWNGQDPGSTRVQAFTGPSSEGSSWDVDSIGLAGMSAGSEIMIVVTDPTINVYLNTFGNLHLTTSKTLAARGFAKFVLLPNDKWMITDYKVT